MTKYREIIRLTGLGFSQRNIMASCGVSQKTVVKVQKRARELNISWPLDESMTDTELQKLMFSKESKVSASKKIPYEVVIDNYRSGKYPKRDRFGDEFFKTQGGLMEAFASVGELSEEIAAGLRIERDEALQTIVRSRQELRGRFGETKQELAERYETILQKVDRYL